MDRPNAAYHRVNQRSTSEVRPSRDTPQISSVQQETAPDCKAAPRSLSTKKRSVPENKIKTLYQRFARLTDDSWLWELCGMLLCLSTLISIVGICLAYNHKPQPHTIVGISLNTLVSILATISRAATIFVAASILAQQKWLRFIQSRGRLSEMTPYDDATRGPLGSLCLLLSMPQSVVVVVVALVTVLALGFEPFVQQSLRFPLRQLLVENQSPVLRASTNLSYAGDRATSNATFPFNAVLIQALYSDLVTPIEPACPEGNCRWPSYWTAAVCSSCEDILHNTTIKSADSQAWHDYKTLEYLDGFKGFDDLTEGPGSVFNHSSHTNHTVTMGDAPPYIITTNMSSHLTTDGFLAHAITQQEEVLMDASIRSIVEEPYSQELPPALADKKGPLSTLGYFKLETSDDGLQMNVVSATRCSISLCARQQSSTTVNGTFRTHVNAQTWGNYTQGLRSYVFNSGYIWMAQLGRHVFQTQDGAVALYPTVTSFDNMVMSLIDVSARTLQTGRNLDGERDTHTDLSPNTHQFVMDMHNASARIAQAYTNYFHQNGDTPIYGKAYTTVPFVDVQWPWLIFPLILILICFINLLITIYQTRKLKLPTWRTSVYPLIFSYPLPYSLSESIPLPRLTLPRSVTGDENSEGAEEEPKPDEYQPSDDSPLQKQETSNVENPPEEVREDRHKISSSESVVATGNRLSDYEAMAMKTLIRLRRHDGHWEFHEDTG